MFSLILFCSCFEAPTTNADSAITEPSVESETEPAVEPTSEHTAEPSVEPATEPAVEPTSEPAEEPVTEPAIEPAVEPAEEPQFDVPRLRIALTWIHAGDDMDLHILNGTDSSLLNGAQDCHYANCLNGLDWGVQGELQDNPLLLQHDDLGTGPEEATIDHPQDGALYTIYVHDYPESLFEFNHNVTVTITLDGLEMCSVTKNVFAENSYIAFMEINWDLQACTAL